MEEVIPGKGRWRVVDGLQHNVELLVVEVGQGCAQCQHRSAWAASQVSAHIWEVQGVWCISLVPLPLQLCRAAGNISSPRIDHDMIDD